MSLTYRINNRGARMLPCGTPDVTGAQSDWQPSITTRWDRPWRKLDSQESREPVMPKRSSLSRRRSWGTESKAFSKSRNITSVERRLSSALAHSWKRCINWEVQEYPGRKPYWWLLSRLFDSINPKMRLYISLSRVFTIRLVREIGR